MKRKLIFSGRLTLFILLAGIVSLIGIYTYAFFSPRLELTNLGKLYLYDNNEQLVFQGTKGQEWVSLEDMSENLIHAVISVEDKNFYHRHGFDYFRI